MNPVNQPILLALQPVPLIRILQAGLLELIQQLFLLGPIPFQALLLVFKGQQGSRSLTPELPCRTNLLRAFGETSPTETIEPTTLLTGPGQLLCLTLNGEIDEQGPQILQLLPVDRDAIQA